ncbi:SymE family type I addiction module toxin [Chryseobacterium sp. MIQD13]|uniref:SymE family type I addiction module toxin n=1 Tax=Chryseobacterium sp. MIQD13 TaxID=3422310 RepID=UPI003D27BBFB
MMKKEINFQNKYKLFRSRNLKVFRKSFARAYYREVFFPEIRIAGKWVQDCGFEAGDRVAVTVSRNRIILRKV